MIRLLLVEDDPADQELVRRGLRDAGPHAEPIEVTVVESIDEALARLERETFAMILTDYSLPKRSGLDLLRDLRTRGNTTPVVMLTGSADTAVAVTALQDGAADFVIKDIAYEHTLAVVVRRAIEKHGVASALENPRDGGQGHVQRLEREIDTQARELRRALQESEALRRLAQSLASTRALTDALDLVSRATAQLLRAQACAVLLRHGAEYVLINAWGPLKHPTGIKHADLPKRLANDWVTVASATMREDDEPIGLLWVGRACHGDFAPHETELLEAVADLTALSIAKLRAREQLRRLREGPAPVAPDSGGEPELSAPTPHPPDHDPAPADRSTDPTQLADSMEQTTVLIVDDSAKVLTQARLALERSMTVLTATSGKLALEKYAATRPAVVIVDLVMPDMDGLTTLAELQKLGCTTCLALAVRGDAASHERARKAGYLGVVEKPLREGELAAQIATALAAAEGLGPDHFSEDDGYPVLTLPNPSLRALAKLLPLFDRRLRALAEDGSDRLIVDATSLTQITPEHVTMLARLFSEAQMLGIEPVICAADEPLVTKLRQIVELREARYVPTRDAAKLHLQ